MSLVIAGRKHYVRSNDKLMSLVIATHQRQMFLVIAGDQRQNVAVKRSVLNVLLFITLVITFTAELSSSNFLSLVTSDNERQINPL